MYGLIQQQFMWMTSQEIKLCLDMAEINSVNESLIEKDKMEC